MKHEKGFTLLEVVIGLAIGGMLATIVATTIPTLMQWAPRQANKLSVEADLSFIRYWLTRDANAAESFTALSAPQYGRFQWSDYSGESMVSYNVTYSYDSAADSIIREEWQNGTLQSSLPVARKILNQSDVLFTWSAATSQLTANITATIEDAPGVGTHSRSATIVTTLRTSEEPIVSPPSDVPIPPPPPGSEYYYIYAAPTIVLGDWVSGDYTSLHDADSTYYVVDAEIISGTKYVAWWGVSEELTAPVTISEIEVRFAVMVDRQSAQDVTVEFFVKDSAAGFPAVAASGFTFTQSDVLIVHSFFLDATALAYVNSLPQRRVTVKIQTTANPMYTLYTDQVIIIASP